MKQYFIIYKNDLK